MKGMDYCHCESKKKNRSWELASSAHTAVPKNTWLPDTGVVGYRAELRTWRASRGLSIDNRSEKLLTLRERGFGLMEGQQGKDEHSHVGSSGDTLHTTKMKSTVRV